eukprot:TRINITY_DN3220_c0_g1_i1.p1 TRINITY_DN3220_c0_g1~~TRINITY_DN3220_c0_g1_i1.p1  ORF type:complete len:366 (-),score=36.59 TRINITY_DN3220_c0_g1_i1:339-1436(-)
MFLRRILLLPALVSLVNSASEDGATKDGKPLIIASVTSIPSRYRYLHKTVDSLMRQTLKPDVVLLVLPQAYKNHRSQAEPEFLRNSNYGSRLLTLRTEEDFGPASKLIPAIALSDPQNCKGCGDWIRKPPFSDGKIPTPSGLRAITPDTRIIVFDDDRTYNPWVIELFVYLSQLKPELAIGSESHNVDGRGYTGEPRWCSHMLAVGKGFESMKKTTLPLPDNWAGPRLKTPPPINRYGILGITPNDQPVWPGDILLGCGGALYQPKFFNVSELSDLQQLSDYCFQTDDVWIAGHLEKQGVQRLRLLSLNIEKGADWTNERHEGENLDPLLSHNRQDRYHANCRCAHWLHQTFGIWRNPSGKKIEL